MAIYKQDIINIDLDNGNIHRSFLNHSIGSGDAAANRFGVRVFRGNEPVSLTDVVCQGFFRNSQGENIALTSHGTVQDNMAYVTLPQACYNYEGAFTLSIKLIGGGVTGTMRIVDGSVDNTNTGSAVAPTGAVPTYQEVLAVYNQAAAATEYYQATRNSIAGLFSSSKAYKTGEYVFVGGTLFQFTSDKAAGDWDGTYTKEAEIGEDLENAKGELQDNINAYKEEAGQYKCFIPYTISAGVYDRQLNLNTEVGNHLTAAVKENHLYEIAGRRYAVSYPAVIFMHDSTLIRVENYHVGLNERFTNLLIMTPEGCNKVYINGETAGYDTGAPMIKEVNYLNPALASIPAPFEPQTGVYDMAGTLNTAVGAHAVVNVAEGDLVRFSAYKWANTYPVVLYKKNGSIIGYSLSDLLASWRVRNQLMLIPAGVDQIIIQGDAREYINFEKVTQDKEVMSWVGKKILFLGTSLSATGTAFRGQYYTMPDYVCYLLGATAIDMAKGESMVRRGYEFAISESDPYGWTGGYWNNVAYSLMTTLQEKNDLITNWTSKWYALLQGPDKPATLTDEQKALFRSCSFENRVIPYLDGTNERPDMIVIEHGRNDVVWWNPTAETMSGKPGVNPDSKNDYHRSKYGDAMAYLIRLIREYRRDIPILLVGHFDNSGVFEGLQEIQKEAADYNGIFYCDTLATGWNDCKVTVTGQWSNGYWVEDGTERVYTRRHQNMPDDIHPASAKSGDALRIHAGIVAKFIKANIVPQD